MAKIIEHPIDIEFRVYQEPPIGDGVQIYITGKNHANDKRVYVPSLEFVELPEDGTWIRPTLFLSPHRSNALQVLMDDLWNVGIRPTEGVGSAGAMTATQEHLKDMKRIAFDLLKTILKNETHQTL